MAPLLTVPFTFPTEDDARAFVGVATHAAKVACLRSGADVSVILSRDQLDHVVALAAQHGGEMVVT